MSKKAKIIITIILVIIAAMAVNYLYAQAPTNYSNKVFLEQLYKDSTYLDKKNNIDKEFLNVASGKWGEFVKGVDEDLITQNKIIALTLDACGGLHGDGYDNELIDLLIKEKVSATLFFTGKWIDANYNTFLELSKNPLFEIENHGFNHKPCSVDGESEYGIKGTLDVPDAFDEIEANEQKITAITGRRPKFYRSATAFTDEACAKIASQLSVIIISYDILSGDAVANTPTSVIEKNVLTHLKPGATIIMHLNHPEWNGYEALTQIIPKAKADGYTFAKLDDYPLKGK